MNKFVIFIAATLFADWLLQQQEFRGLEQKYAPRVPGVVAASLIAYGLFY